MITEFIHWNANPEIFRIGNFAIRWYGLFFAASFYIGYLIMTRFFKKEGVPLKVLDGLAMYMIIGTVVGARLGHCLFYQPDYYLANPWEILKVWEGGLASHGAGIGILLALYLFVRKYKVTYFWVIDRIVIVVALSGMFIRLGNLMNSEIYGYATNVPWAFIFVRDDMIPRHPTQIYEALSYLLIFIYLLYYYYKKDGKPREGYLFGLFLVLVFGMRFLIEFLKEPQVGFENQLILNLGQSLSIPFVLLGLLILFWPAIRKKNNTT